MEPHRVRTRVLGIEPLPQNLSEAIAVMESSELVAETLGEQVFDFFLRNKRHGVAGVPRASDSLRANALPALAVVARWLTPVGDSVAEPVRRRCSRSYPGVGSLTLRTAERLIDTAPASISSMLVDEQPARRTQRGCRSRLGPAWAGAHSRAC